MKKKILITIKSDRKDRIEAVEKFFFEFAEGFNKECPAGSKMTVEVVHTPGLK